MPNSRKHSSLNQNNIQVKKTTRLTSMTDDNPLLPFALARPTKKHNTPQVIYKVKAVDPQRRVREGQGGGAEALGVAASLDGEARVAGDDERRQESRIEGGGDEAREGRGCADGYEAVAVARGMRRGGEGELGVGEGFGEGCGEVGAGGTGTGGRHRGGGGVVAWVSWVRGVSGKMEFGGDGVCGCSGWLWGWVFVNEVVEARGWNLELMCS
ncbi:hypothetical protein IMZ48_12000 [Candidatus Bathyarchaeota archaeon]|nr:hypothetical protein [Candidatus Bathyarchaeota archaeon]